MGSIEYINKKNREKEWDAICTLNGTDLYGLLDKILEDPRLIDKIKNVKTIFRIPEWLREAEEELKELEEGKENNN